MNTINFGYTGGFPFEQHTFDKMQNAYLDVMISLLGFLRIPNIGNHVMFGCQVVGNSITPGMMYIDGDLCSFAGVAGNGATKIKKSVVFTNAAFQNGFNNPVYKQTTALVDEDGVALSAFTRYTDALVYDPNYIHTDNNFTTSLLNKLLGIQAGAQVNVQADFNVTNPLSDAFIKNQPNFLNVLEKGGYFIGNPGNQDYTVPLPTNVGTSNYSVYVTFESTPANASQSATYFYVIHSKTQSSFKIWINELGNYTQALDLRYFLIAN